MRKRIRQLARGKFDYVKPELTFSQTHIEFDAIENTSPSGSFTVTGDGHVPIRGVVYSTNPRMECLTPQFEGNECVIRYRFWGDGLAEGENQTGDFVIVCNQREYSLSFCVNISKHYMDSSVGIIKTLYDFSNLAKENWGEAYQLFYNKNFSNIMKPQEVKEAMIYRGMVAAKPSDNNLEEFLVGIRKKNPIHFTIAQDQFTLEQLQESCKETIEIHKDNWGYLEIEVSADQSFVQLSRERITTEDFMGSTCMYEFVIDAGALHAGRNFATITFSGIRQIATVTVEVDNIQEEEATRSARAEMNECKAGIVELYQAYRLKRIVTGVWANETIQILDHLQQMDPDEPMYMLMKAQVLVINRQRQEAEWILDEFKREWVDRKAPVYGYYLYVMTLMEREPSYVDRMTREIEGIFRENPDSVLLFWVLTFLEEEYYNNNAHKLKAIEYWVKKGTSSPYLYLEAYYLIWQDPYLLTRLGTFEIRILRWAIRHHALNKEIADQIFRIIETRKGFEPVLYELMCAAYEVDPKPANVGMICSYLIKAQQYDRVYHSWYAKGVELELRITGLYEAYMLSMDEREIFEVPKIIQMYFQYETSLPYRKMAVLYNNIIAGKTANPETYNKYRRVMGRFAMEQIEQLHMDDNLAVVYRDMLELGLVNEDIAHALAKILFTQKLIVTDSKMVRAIIYQYQLMDPQIVPISDNTAYFQLYTSEYAVVFEDEKGKRYIGNVDFQVEQLMDPAPYLAKCMELAPTELAYILSYFETRRSYLTFTENDKKFFPRILFGRELSLPYRARMIPEMVRFYQTQEYDGVIRDYLEQANLEDLPPVVRRYLMELLIENHLYEKCYELLEKFGIDQIGSAGKVALASYFIRRLSAEDQEDEFLVSLCEQGFLANKYNDDMLSYLCRYYQGPSNVMYAIWKASVMFELHTMELEERLLVQMLYSEQLLPETEAIFKSYYDNGGRELVVLAYLSYRCHTYFRYNAECEEYVFEMVQSRYVYHMELNDACKLGLLYYLSGCKQIDNTQHAIEDELLEEFTCRNMNFAFYKKLDKRLVMKYHFYDKVFLEYRANPRKHVVLHYSRDEDGQNFVAEDMQDVYYGIFVKPFVMFFGEMVQYYISEEYKGEVSVSKSNRIMNHDVYGEKDESRYNLINQMLISATLQDDNTLYRNMKQYAGYEQVTARVFHLL